MTILVTLTADLLKDWMGELEVLYNDALRDWAVERETQS